MSWNYRVFAIDYGDGIEYGIYEVYYEGDTVVARTENPVPIVGDSMHELAFALEYMKNALDKDILTDKDFGEN
jgi:hypothetical protein